MSSRDYVGVADCHSLLDLAVDNVWRFMEGVYPVVGAAPLLAETEPIHDDLAALNGAGFLIYQTQVGSTAVLSRRGLVEQRAFVHGYAHADTAARIAKACDTTLEWHVTPVADLEYVEDPRPHTDTHRHVTDGTWAGGTFQCPPFDLHENNLLVVEDDAYEDIDYAMAVTVIDLEWGRERHLWSTLIHALAS